MDTTVIIAISIIALGFVILAGLAIWLAVDRQRRNQQTPAAQPLQQSAPKPARQSPAPASPSATTPDPPAAKQALASHADPQHSGEYPSAELYDQTLLPTHPKRRTRKPQ
ncbi:MAG TPA: hypothetical protein VFU32_13615 [Ktedonobacterales bacterium]|nr:hypothetical protein [Ktedonobacterales bacterium]